MIGRGAAATRSRWGLWRDWSGPGCETARPPVWGAGCRWARRGICRPRATSMQRRAVAGPAAAPGLQALGPWVRHMLLDTQDGASDADLSALDCEMPWLATCHDRRPRCPGARSLLPRACPGRPAGCPDPGPAASG